MSQSNLEARIRQLEEELTTRKTAEMALLRGEQHLRSILETSPIGVGIFRNSDRLISYANSRCARILGYGAPFELLGREINEFWASAALYQKYVSDFEEFGTLESTEVQLRNRNNKTFWAMVSWNKISVDQEPCTLFWIFDITDRKRAEAEITTLNEGLEIMVEERTLKLQASEHSFKMLFENAEVSIWNEDFSEVYEALEKLRDEGVTDLHNYLRDHEKTAWNLSKLVKVHHINEATLNLFGSSTEDDFLNRINTTFGPGAIDVFTNQLCAIWDKRKSFRSEAKFTNLNGENIDAIISLSIPETKEGFQSIPVTIIDITERKKLEQQLRRSQKMEAVGQLTGGIAHDFNNILGIVLGNLEIIQNLPPGDSKIPGRIDIARRTVERGADITRKLLGFSRKGPNEKQLVDINGLVNSLLELIAKSLTVSIDVRTNLSDDLWTVEIDPGDFEDAILNLALNARDAMPDGGNLTIETVNKILDENFVGRNPQAETGNFISVSIRDTGIGMSGKEKAKVFEPFFTTKEVGKGTGLGLSMVYGFVERSGGFVILNSEKDIGTTFHLFFPRAIKKEAGLVEQVIETDNLPKGLEKILIVDDEEGLRDIAAFSLDELGYETLMVEDGESALKILEKEHDIDLLFSDVVMPNFMNAYELVQKVRKNNSQLKILLTSGYDRNLSENVNGDDPFFIKLNKAQLKKPYSISELAIAVRKVLDEEL